MRPRAATLLLIGLSIAIRPAATQTTPEPGSPTRPPVTEKSLRRGRHLYLESCVYCHGPAGHGDGPVVFFLSRSIAPRPRDFSRGAFKYRSTASGELPTDADLFRVITEGRPGLMPSFAALSREERWSLVHYVKTLTPGFAEDASRTEPIFIGQPITPSPRSIDRGEVLFVKLQCWKCHGIEGRGDGPAGETLKTTQGLKILAADLTRPSSFGNGHRPEDVYRTLMTGLNGVPMPSYAQVLTEEDAWNLVNFVLSLDREGD